MLALPCLPLLHGLQCPGSIALLSELPGQSLSLGLRRSRYPKEASGVPGPLGICIMGAVYLMT